MVVSHQVSYLIPIFFALKMCKAVPWRMNCSPAPPHDHSLSIRTSVDNAGVHNRLLSPDHIVEYVFAFLHVSKQSAGNEYHWAFKTLGLKLQAIDIIIARTILTDEALRLAPALYDPVPNTPGKEEKSNTSVSNQTFLNKDQVTYACVPLISQVLFPEAL